jgi:hypothetical protein
MAEAPYRIWREQAFADAPFIVCALFTPDYRSKAERLVASLKHLGLSHALFEAPQVHRSISTRGGEDLAFSKPRFIAHAMRHFRKPVLYVDADMIFRKTPERITALCAQGCDFAIYNWLADAMNDAWRPEPGTPLWNFFFSVDLASDSQLMASGAVQLWAGTDAAFVLLTDWEQSLLRHPKSEDDHCLDFAYNHGDRTGLKPGWLPKDHVRYAFWIYADPVIDHPEFPTPITGHFEALGSERFDRGKITRAEKQQPFPREAIVDAEAKQLLMPAPDGHLVPSGPLPLPLYLPHD